MTNDLFAQPTALETSASLADRIFGFDPTVRDEYFPTTNDKWLLASNLQKSIRRGFAEAAVATAIRLLAVDASYFWRRLLVIAYEDVGFGNLPLCFDLLKTFRRNALHQQLGVQRVAGYFAHQLAVAVKSRALCDAIAMFEFSVRRGDYEVLCFGMSDAQLLDVACSANRLVMERVAALRHVCGYHEFSHGIHRTLTPPRPELIHEICCRLRLSETEARLFVSGQSCSESLNIGLPIVAMMVRGAAKTVQQSDIGFFGKNGLLYCALDRHTRSGKKSLAIFAREAAEVRSFFDTRPDLEPVATLGVATFIVEGSNLNCWLVHDGATDLRNEFEQNFLEHAGATGKDQRLILHLVQENLECLNEIRTGLMP